MYFRCVCDLCLLVCELTIFPTSGIRAKVVEIVGKLAKMFGLKFDIERFDWKINFSIWQSNVKDVLV